MNSALLIALLTIEVRERELLHARRNIGRPYSTFRTLLDEAGAPMKVQQELMRHSHIRTTMNVCGKAMDEANARRTGKSFASYCLRE